MSATYHHRGAEGNELSDNDEGSSLLIPHHRSCNGVESVLKSSKEHVNRPIPFDKSRSEGSKLALFRLIRIGFQHTHRHFGQDFRGIGENKRIVRDFYPRKKLDIEYPLTMEAKIVIVRRELLTELGSVPKKSPMSIRCW